MKIQKFTLAVYLLVAILINPATNVSATHQLTSVPINIAFDPIITSGLTQPLFATHAGDGSGRLFIAQRGGEILIYSGGTLNTATPFLDVGSLITTGGGEQGLLGLAFDPDYASNGYFYITYTRASDGADVLARYQVSSGDPDVADTTPANIKILLTISEPEANHNGGMIAFGPDGYLYFAVGDGGGGGDDDAGHGTIGNGQDKTTLLGKMLRLDVDIASPYIPAGNPFVGVAGRDEIWSYGLRNPWRFSFDRNTGDLYIGDVGQGSQEEIDFQAAGAAGGQNYGWRIREGNACYNPSSGCISPAGYVAPVATYSHGAECSVTGGYVYRGSEFPGLAGVYLYGDFCSGKLWGMYKNASDQWVSSVINAPAYNISSFAEDEDGELYIVDYNGQLIHITSWPQYTTTFYSQAAYDGSIRESAPASNMGGTVFSSDPNLQVGDDQQGRHYKSILSFDTSSVPDVAILAGATLEILANGVYATKTIPYKIFGPLRIDTQKGSFGNNAPLMAGDYQAAPTKSNVAVFAGAPAAGWYSTGIPSSSLISINKTGPTEFRIYFASFNHVPLVGFYSGDNAPCATNCPQLTLTYYAP